LNGILRRRKDEEAFSIEVVVGELEKKKKKKKAHNKRMPSRVLVLAMFMAGSRCPPHILSFD